MTVAASSRLARQIAAAGLDWMVPDWPVPPGVRALVTTRNGNAGPGSFGTTGLGAGTGDTSDPLAESRRLLRAFLPAEPRWMRQVHGTVVAIHDAQSDAAPVEADAAVTHEPGVVCVVLTADCLPVMLADRHGSAVGVAHAGWRGLAAGVLERTVAAFVQIGVREDDLVAWLGPAIGPAAFEVGADVLDAFDAQNRAADACFLSSGPGKWHADLFGIARRRLAECGVTSVGGGGVCTHSDSARFYSWRRDRDGGRMAALAWLAPEEPAPHV
jgi:YfiH family protein